jgi:hypothetical protein
MPEVISIESRYISGAFDFSRYLLHKTSISQFKKYVDMMARIFCGEILDIRDTNTKVIFNSCTIYI